MYREINNRSAWYIMLNKFLDPKNDIAFKRIFGSERNKDILIRFLNDMLCFKANLPIKEVKFLKSVQDPEIAAKKTSIVDILCQDEENNYYIVEMQVAKEKGFVKRAQYYAAKAYSSQLKIGEQFNNLKEVIFLAITNFTMFPEKANYKSDHIILDRDSFEHDLKDFSFSFLELSKFNKTIDQLATNIEKWAYFFKYAEETKRQDLSKIIGNDQIIARAYEELNHFNWTDDDLTNYEEAIKKDMDYNAAMEQKYDDGVEKGLKQGMEQGIKKGIKQGVTQVAVSMLKEGLDLKMISKVTGLTVEQIQEIII